MSRVVFKSVVLWLCIQNVINCAPKSVEKQRVYDNMELVMTFLVHRHGDRAPNKNLFKYSNDPVKLEELTKPYGYSQLTDAGKRRGYQLGKFIRKRYNQLLSPKFNKSELYLRSTDSVRAKLTALTAMAGVYPVDGTNWSRDLKWDPVPYTSVEPKYDYMLYTVNCPNYGKIYNRMINSYTTKMADYSDLTRTLTQEVKFNFTALPLKIYSLYDLLDSQIHMGLPLTPSINAMLPQIKEAAAICQYIIFEEPNTHRLSGGVLLQQFFNAADELRQGEPVQRVRIYSGHDFNVLALSATSKVRPYTGVPGYASAFALEVKKNVLTQEYYVQPIYIDSPDTEVQNLKIDGCSNPCPLDKFRELTSEYLVDVSQWREDCGFSEDMKINTAIID